MKRIALALVVVAFAAAPTAVEYRKVFINGKLFANAQKVQGTLSVPVESLAKALGWAGAGGLGPNLQLQGTKLVAVAPQGGSQQIIGEEGSKPVIGEDSSRPVAAASVMAPAGVIAIRPLLKVARPFEISSKVALVDGKAWVPLTDVAKALGASLPTDSSKVPGNSPLRLTVSGLCDGCVLVLR